MRHAAPLPCMSATPSHSAPLAGPTGGARARRRGQGVVAPAKPVRVDAGGVAPSPLDAGIKSFITYCRIECGFAPATLHAYATDLAELRLWLDARGVKAWGAVNLQTIADHLKSLDARGLATSSIA